MNKTFFTSDTHFGHRNVISFCNRPFRDVEEMDAEMTRRWNELVDDKDDIYVIGDFAFHNQRAVPEILKDLRGRKHLVWGNHDSNQTRKLPLWASAQPYLELKLDGRFVILSHYAHRVWNQSHRGSLMLYGHTHGTLPGNSQSLDVGVDAGWDYRPVTLPQILARMATLPAYDSGERRE